MAFLKRTAFLLFTFIFFFPQKTLPQNTLFNADSAYAHIKHLVETIGPRPMGSANEQAALAWVSRKFAAYGADKAYVMKFTQAKTRRHNTNTNSGIAIGIFHGKTDSAIVIGGHIDSSGREIPGANDDASGTASVIELARVWSQRPRHYTMIFTAFGAEEQGLVGSEYFVDNYENLDKVALMLQIDMVGSDDNLILFLETSERQAPTWLVKDVFSAAEKIGIDNLQYPTHFFSMNNSLAGAGSDHMPFLDKNIPAIDFTAGINNSPVHTPQDKLEFIDKDVLAKNGQLLQALIEKYQKEGIPSQRTGNYMLWQVFGKLLFIPNWLMLAINILAVVLGIGALFYSRKKRMLIDKPDRVRFSGTKIIFLIIIVAIFSQLGEAILQIVKGLRYPWLIHLDKYLWLFALCAVVGFWTALQLTKKWHFSPDPYVYVKRALFLLIVLTALFAFSNARIAFYPAVTLALVSLAVLISNHMLKIVLIGIAPLPMVNLMFNEVFSFIGRTSLQLGGHLTTFWKGLLFSTAITAILVLWFLPIIYAFGYTVVDVNSVKKIAKRFRRPAFGLLLLLATIGFGTYLYSLPSYNELWRASLRADATYDLRTGENKIELKGNEFFRGVRVEADEFRREYDETIHQDTLPIRFEAKWFDITGESSRTSGERDTVKIDWKIATGRPWYAVTAKIEADTLDILNVTSNAHYKKSREKILSFRWFAEPPDTLNLNLSFTVTPGARVFRKITAVYPTPPIPIEITADLANVRFRTTVSYSDTLSFASPQTTIK